MGEASCGMARRTRQVGVDSLIGRKEEAARLSIVLRQWPMALQLGAQRSAWGRRTGEAGGRRRRKAMEARAARLTGRRRQRRLARSDRKADTFKGAWGWASEVACGTRCPAASDRRARVEGTVTDKWACSCLISNRILNVVN
jgi:hypothetical protein